MTTSPRGCSVVIPHYGDPALASALARSLLAQTLPPLEVIIVDDASPIPFPDDVDGVTIVRRGINSGFGAAVNAGAEIARGDVLTILNSDVEIGQEFVAGLMAAHSRDGGALVAPAILNSAGTESWACRRFPTLRSQALSFVRIVSGLQYRRSYQAACGMDIGQWEQQGAATSTEWIAGVALSLPRQVVVDVGGFSADFHMYFEEVDLQRRLADRGVARIHDPAVSAVHASGGSTDPMRAAQWEMDSRFVYARRWGHPLLLALVLGAVAVLDAGLDALRRARGRDAHPVRDAGRMLRSVWAAWGRARSLDRGRQ